MSNVIDEAKAKIKGQKLKLVMPEGDDSRIQAAAKILAEQGLAVPILFGAQTPEPSAEAIALVLGRRENLDQFRTRFEV